MPYSDIEKQRKFQRERNRANRVRWLSENGPCRHCGSSQNLQVDHVDRGLKVDHRVWSWNTSRRLAELAKCQVLCKACHTAKTRSELSFPIVHGTRAGYRKGCRCVACTAIQVASVYAWRARVGGRKKRSSPQPSYAGSVPQSRKERSYLPPRGKRAEVCEG